MGKLKLWDKTFKTDYQAEPEDLENLIFIMSVGKHEICLQLFIYGYREEAAIRAMAGKVFYFWVLYVTLQINLALSYEKLLILYQHPWIYTIYVLYIIRQNQIISDNFFSSTK